MRKANDPGGDFFPHQRLADGAANTFAQLHEDRLLGGLDTRQFVERLTVHLDQVNHLHPFREGNGRTQRIFFNQLAERAGYRIDWQQMTGAVNDAAFRASGHGDLGQLRGMLAGIVTRASSAPTDAATSRAAEALRMTREAFPSTLPTRRPVEPPQARSQTRYEPGRGQERGYER